MLSALMAGALLTGARAQPAAEGPPGAGPAPPEPVFIAPIREGGVRKHRGMSIPPNLGFGPARRIGVGYTASNSYLNPGLLVCENRDCQLDYETDHTGNLLFVDFSQPVLDAWEFGLGFGVYRMSEITRFSPLHRLASDQAIRKSHEDILGEDSLPTLSGAPDGRQRFSLSDFAGRRLTLEPDRVYALPLRLDLTRYFAFRPNPRTRLGLNLGLHLAWPLEGDIGSGPGESALARGADAGLAVNVLRSRRITANVSSTFHVQLARFRSGVHVVNPNSPVNSDDRLRSLYAVTFGLRFDGTFAGRAPCSFSLGQRTNTAHYDKEAHYTYDPLVFAGGNNLRGALAGANDYGVMSFACDYRGRQLQLALVEDVGGLSQFVSDDGAGTSYDPDFAVGFSLTWQLGRDGS